MSLIKGKVCNMTASNSSAEEEVEIIKYISCSPQCNECRESFSDPLKNKNSLSDLKERLNGLQPDNQLDILQWLVDFSKLEVRLLKYGPTLTRRRRTLTASRLHRHLVSATAWTAEVASAQLFVIKSILDLYSLSMASQMDAVSSLTDHAVIVLSCSEIFDLIEKVALQNKPAGSLFEWRLVEVYGEYLLQNCWSFRFHPLTCPNQIIDAKPALDGAKKHLDNRQIREVHDDGGGHSAE
jgi:hypothetical protein